MNDQNFHAPVEGVAGRDYIKIYPPGSERLHLGPLQWVKKEYLFGTSITSGWLRILAGIFFTVALVFSLFSALQGLAHLFREPHPSPFVFLLRIGLIVFVTFAFVAARQVHETGCLFLNGSLTGFFKDRNELVFLGTLGGEGTLCPKCRGNLNLYKEKLQPPALRCTINRAHIWPFDLTDVQG